MEKQLMRGLRKETRAPGPFVLHDDLPIPEIGDDDVLIRIRCTAL
mgnify:FL=1